MSLLKVASESLAVVFGLGAADEGKKLLFGTHVVEGTSEAIPPPPPPPPPSQDKGGRDREEATRVLRLPWWAGS